MKVLLMYEPREVHLEELRRAAPGAELQAATDEASAARHIVEADAVLGNRFFLQSLRCGTKLRWMQSNSIGVDRILKANDLLGEITLTNARGVYDDEVADHATALVLALARGIGTARDAQLAREWKRSSLRTLRGTRALVIGWGGVGRGVAQRLAAFGVEVRGARRRAPAGGETTAAGFRVLDPVGWREALPMTDWLILALPLTAETRGIVGGSELAAVKRGGAVINVGRGGTVDEAALIEALRAGHLSGAALDVLEEEPPDQGHAAWSAPGLLLTPHVARSMERPPFRWEPLFAENLRRFHRGKPLLNVVDKEAGY
jgi:phosphoglycerate dehydrogenase-like enzyme